MKSQSYDVTRQCYCNHAGETVTLETRYVVPADFLPDGPARLQTRNCSHFFDCNLQDKVACTHAISLPRKQQPVELM